jgi:glycosyltransferase involved in cell wall biosynthesis
MKILLSAIACNPYHGSENCIGWTAVRTLARDHELWVLTGSRNQPDLQRAAAEGLVPDNVHFIFAGKFYPWHPNRLRARLQSWQEYLHFSRAILPLARQLNATEKFDLVHHVTIATWRVDSPLWQLDIPFVFGPIGGNEQFPAHFFPMLSAASMAFELARMASNVVSRFSPGVRRSLREAAHVFVANPETEQLVKALRGSGNGVSRLLAAFYSTAQAEDFARFARGKNLDGPLRLFAAGSMEGRKGVALALAALARAKAAGVKFHYRIGAGGPEIAHLKKQTARLGLTAEVEFAQSLLGEDYQRELGRTHIFLLPSLRESSGLTMMEAMLAGCVPVVADCGGPGFIVTDECGFKIPVGNRHLLTEQLSKTIIAIDSDRKIILEKGRAASQRIVTGFSEEHYRATVNEVYHNVTQAKSGNEAVKLYATR